MGPLIDNYISEKYEFATAIKELVLEAVKQEEQLTATMKSAKEIFGRLKIMDVTETTIDDTKIQDFLKGISNKMEDFKKGYNDKAWPFQQQMLHSHEAILERVKVLFKVPVLEVLE